MFKNASHIEENLNTILERHGYQSEGLDQGDNYIRIGVNWGYVSAQFEDAIDISTVLALIAVMLLIIFTGYLIIYNIFQISVSNDVRFYGLLKTIGTTGKQIKRIISLQAFLLSALGRLEMLRVIIVGIGGDSARGGFTAPPQSPDRTDQALHLSRRNRTPAAAARSSPFSRPFRR